MSAKQRRNVESEPQEPSFEQALARLEEIAHRLEQGDLPLEEAIALAEEGVQLSRLCERQLSAAEAKVQQLVERMGAPELEPLETESGGEEAEG